MNRTPRSVVVLGMMIVAGNLAAVVAGCGGEGDPAPMSYHCPMHPTYVADRPGDCPVCGMRLVPIEAVGEKQGTNGSHGSHGFYHCPMCPEVRADRPGKCPTCGMDLVPAPTAADTVEGRGPVDVPAAGAALAGIRSVAAVRETFVVSIRAAGQVVADETRVRRVEPKVTGWVERLHVASVGQPVRRGEPLLDIYSPELVALQQEYLSALRLGGRDGELAAAARRRLGLLDVPAAWVSELERLGEPLRRLTLSAPFAGHVSQRLAFEGQQVMPGMPLLEVTDLSRVWVEAGFYEHEAPGLTVGAKATIRFPALPGESRDGRVAFVYPFLEPQTRTIKVRIELDNPGPALKPGMFASVDLAVDGGLAVVVPDGAILDTGLRQLVWVERSPGSYQPRPVTVGVRHAGRAQVVSGLEPGERVVEQGLFLLDSESRIRAAVSASPAGDAHGH